MTEAEKFGQVRAVGEATNDQIPELTKEMFDQDADYIQITTNNTIEGTAFNELPETVDVPLVADMSSDVLATPIDVSNFGVIYAGAQNNIEPAGFKIVSIREDGVDKAADSVATLFN